MSKKRTPLEAIRAKCKECSSGQKNEIINCPVKTCPLWSYRIELELMENIDIEIEQIEEHNQKKEKVKLGKSLLDIDIPFESE